jgi:hypothetical protein
MGWIRGALGAVAIGAALWCCGCGSGGTVASGTTTTTTNTAAADCALMQAAYGLYTAATGVTVTCDTTYGYVNSYGVQYAHPMMNGILQSNNQVVVPQNFTGTNAWKIPLVPVQDGTTTSVTDGPIGVAVDGVPIFNPCTQGGTCDATTNTLSLGQLDVCNGHAGRADDYHYHAAPICLMADEPTHYWDTHPVGYALDGYAIFGYYDADGTVATRDAGCGGNTSAVVNGPSGYSYHLTDIYPFILGCLEGVPSPDLAAQGGKYSPLGSPGAVVNDTNLTLKATQTSLAVGGTSSLQYTSGGAVYSITYTRTSNLCWTFVYATNGVQTGSESDCRQF